MDCLKARMQSGRELKKLKSEHETVKDSSLKASKGKASKIVCATDECLMTLYCTVPPNNPYMLCSLGYGMTKCFTSIMETYKEHTRQN